MGSMLMESDMEDAMKIYAPLFQPLRDLAKNWTIDIEKCLEGFIDWMRQVHEIERSSGGHFNFAQAALVVAGGAEVYGRKVDYVYQLTRGFFDQLNEKAKKKKEGQVGEDGDNNENVDLDMTRNPEDPCEWIKIKLRPVDQKTLMLKRSSCKPPKLLSVIPMELVPLTTEEKMDVALYDSANPNVLIGMKDDFKMNTAFIHKSGAMLLDLINERIINDFSTKEIVTEVTRVVQNLQEMEVDDGVGGFQDNAEDDARPSGSRCEIHREAGGTQLPGMASMHEHATGLLSDAEVMPPAPCNPVDLLGDSDVEFFSNDEDAGSSETDEEGEPPHPADVEGFVDAEIEEVDLFVASENRHVPPKVVRKYNLANNLIRRQRRRRVAAGLDPDVSLMEYMHNDLYRKSAERFHKPTEPFSSDMPVVALSEFARKVQKKRTELRNIARKRANLEVEEHEEEAADGDAEAEAGVAFDDEVASIPELANDAPEEELQFGDALDNDDMDSNFRDVVFTEPNADDEAVPAGEMSFNARLRHYLNIYWAEGEEIHSKLDERVQQWDETVTPLLEEEEKRPTYKIHEYGSKLLERFEKIGERKDFFEVVDEILRDDVERMETAEDRHFNIVEEASKKQYDVSRFFLSSLVLANTYNFELEYSDDFTVQDEAKGMYLGSQYSLKLIGLERHHDAVERAVT